MTKQQPRPTTLSQILKVLIITSALAVITQAETSEKSLLSSCPAVDMAAQTFADGRQDVAAKEFEKISQEESAPSFARGLALFGLAEVALAQQNFNEAIEFLGTFGCQCNITEVSSRHRPATYSGSEASAKGITGP